jgi:hypothetical protein
LLLTLLFLLLPVLSCASKPRPAVQQPVEESVPAEEFVLAEESEQPPEEAPADQEYKSYSRAVILEGAKTHKVVWTNTLTGIAKRYYGSANGYYFPLILLASGDVAGDPDLIISGTALTIPDLRRNLNDPAARQQLKEYIYEIADVYSMRMGKNWGARSRNQLRALADSL